MPVGTRLLVFGQTKRRGGIIPNIALSPTSVCSIWNTWNFASEISNWDGRLDIQASVDLEGLKKLRTMLEKYEGIVLMMEPNDEAANWGGLRSVALCLPAIARHFRAISNTILLAGSKDSKWATRSYSLALARYSSALVGTTRDP
jgi:hypothetical protein